MKSFTGKTVFLTGAASGIGRNLAQQLADLGCHLYLVDIDDDGLRNVAAEISKNNSGQVWTRSCDLSCSDSVSAALADFEQQADVIDIVINNAGIAYYGPTDAMTQAQWDRLMAINLLAPIQITRHFLPLLSERPDAHIVNMCSISGLVAGGRFAAYHTSKFGLIGFTQALRAEYGRKGIGVSAICPGPVRTKLYDKADRPDGAGNVPTPPRWVCTTADRVASVTIKAMKRNRRQVLVTPLAHGLFQMQRFLPGLIDFANQLSRKKKKRLAELQRQEDDRLALLADTESTPVQAKHRAA